MRNAGILFMMFLFLVSTAIPVAFGKSVMVFVSFSMPDDALKAWMTQAEKIRAPVIVRGLIHNSFAETTGKVTELLKKMNGAKTGVQINPLLFRQYGIEKVPAVIVQEGNSYDVFYGNTTLEYALSKVADRNDSVSGYAKNILLTLKKSWNQK